MPNQPTVRERNVEVVTVVGGVQVVTEYRVDVIETSAQGPQGVAGPAGTTGPQGPRGDVGAAGSDSSYTHNQGGASTLWTINHNLGKKPAVTVVDSGDNVVFGEVSYIDDNSLTIAFSVAFGGKAYLN